MHVLAYSDQGSAEWRRPLPTFLVDGRDICEHLHLLRYSWDTPGIGVVPADAFLYPERTVLHRFDEGRTERQYLLDIDLGDCCGSFLTVQVTAREGCIEWSNFDTCEGVKTLIVPCGPFSFDRRQYAAVMAQVALAGWLDARRNWPDTVNESMLELTWQAEVGA